MIVVAKTPEALAFFSGAFKDRTVSKTYLAIAVGLPQPDEPRAGPSYTSSIPTEGSDVKTEGAAPAPVTAAGKFAEVEGNVKETEKEAWVVTSNELFFL